MSVFTDQYKFLEVCGQTEKNLDNERLYDNLIIEENDEFRAEGFYHRDQSPNAIKEALDLLYVTVGYLNVTIGPEKAAECFAALQKNNMSKCTNGKLIKNEAGKVIKPESYKKLDLTEILNASK